MFCRICGCSNPKCRCKLCKSKSANRRLAALSSTYKNFQMPQVSTASYGSTVPTNEEKMGLKVTANSLAEIDAAESLNITAGTFKLQKKPYSANDILNTNWFKKSHKEMFGLVWDWGGKFRNHETNIGVLPYEITAKLEGLVRDTKTWIEFSSYNKLEIIARFHHGLVMIHPFPNGNGRWSRIITTMLAQALGCDINWAGLAQKANKQVYINALQEADSRKFKPIVAVMSDLVKENKQ